MTKGAPEVRLIVRCCLALAATLVGCSFEHGALNPGGSIDAPDGDGPIEIDARSIDVVRDIPHVPSANEASGTGDYVMAATTINTSTLTITPAPPTGVTFEVVAQEPNGSPLFVIHARTITIPTGVTVSATGVRPLVLLADSITIAGTLDGAARADVPGPNGGTSAIVGAGGPGVHQGVYHDSGGGGGGYGTSGAVGGSAGTTCNPLASGGPAGAMSGGATLTVLAGGAPGGVGSRGACVATKAGAGGGAIQLSARISIVIESTGVLNVGGGGATGGLDCGLGDAGAGNGGGAGGALYLDAVGIRNDGVVAANGGGGGGGGSSPGMDGGKGGDGLGSTTFAPGGVTGGTYGAVGGRGGFGATAATAGGNNGCDGNGGGGGGSVGRIVLHVSAQSAPTGNGLQTPVGVIETF